jgi:predicted transposase YbfD/YdcC
MQWEPKHTIAAQIQAAKADYILSLKANHPTLLAQVQGWFETAQTENQLPQSSEYKLESAHHRIEIRQVWTLPIECFPQLHEAHEWIGLRTIVVVKRRRHLWHKTTHEVQFSLSSLPADSSRIGAAIRQHWGIENAQHWVLDVTFGEDACRVLSLHAPQILAVLRRFALHVLNQEATCKRRLKQKSKQTAMNDLYMLKLLAAALPDNTETTSSETR